MENLRKKVSIQTSKIELILWRNIARVDFILIFWMLISSSVSLFSYSVVCFFTLKPSLLRIVGISGSEKTMSLSDTIFSLGFSFSMTLSSFPIRRSPDNVWVVFVATWHCQWHSLKFDVAGKGYGSRAGGI